MYRELERGILNVVTISSVYLAGPVWSYKIVHFLTYLAGSISLLILLRKTVKVNFWGFLAAHFIYFFCFFHIYHQQHFNHLLTTYLYPLGFLLVYKYIETKKDTFIFLNAALISYLFYGGSTEFVFILLVSELLFFVCFIEKLNLKDLASYYLKFIPLFVILILPALVAGYSLYINSVRLDAFDYREGSFSPAMLLTLIYPFLFNREGSYLGFTLNSEFLIQETYIYSGLAAVVCALIALFSLKDARLRRFSILVILVFLFLALIKFIPLFNSIDLPVFSLFRYWIRFVIVLNLALAILCAYFITNLTGNSQNIDIKFRKMLYLVPVGIVLMLIEVLWRHKAYGISLVRFLVKNNQHFRSYNLAYFAIAGGLIVFLVLLKTKRLKQAGIFISILIVFDLLFFGKMASDYAMFIKTKNLFIDCGAVPVQRVLDLSGCINGNSSLFYKSWGIFGSSALVPKDVSVNLSKIGLTSTRRILHKQDLNVQDAGQLESLRNLGIWYVYEGSQQVLQLNNSFFRSGPYLIEEEKSGEEEHSAAISSDEKITINTYIRYDADWKVFVDGKQIGITKNSFSFVSFPLERGRHYVLIKYIPSDLYFSCLAGFALVVVYFGAYKVLIAADRRRKKV